MTGRVDGRLLENLPMSFHFVRWPAVCPDYSGAAAVLGRLGALLVFCDPGACAGGFARLSGFDPHPLCDRTVSAELDELEIAFGDAEELADRISEAFRFNPKPLIALIGTPVSAMSGVDLRWVATELHHRLALPVLVISTSGFDTYDIGVAKAFDELAGLVLPREAGPKKPSVNILGLNGLEPDEAATFHRVSAFLEEMKLALGAVWTENNGFENLERTAQGAFNLVVSQSGLNLARQLKERYGQPYSFDLPFGDYTAHKLVDALQGAPDLSLVCAPDRRRLAGKVASGPDPAWEWGRTLVVGEPVWAYNLRGRLVHDFDLPDVDAVSLIGVDSALAGSVMEMDDEAVYGLLCSGKYATVVADVCLRESAMGAGVSRFRMISYTALGGPDSSGVWPDARSYTKVPA